MHVIVLWVETRVPKDNTGRHNSTNKAAAGQWNQTQDPFPAANPCSYCTIISLFFFKNLFSSPLYFSKGTFYIPVWSLHIGSRSQHLWGICDNREKEKQRETSMSFQAPSQGLLECWWEPDVWGNVLSPRPAHTYWSSPSHWSKANNMQLPWPTESGAVKVSKWCNDAVTGW